MLDKSVEDPDEMNVEELGALIDNYTLIKESVSFDVSAEEINESEEAIQNNFLMVLST